VEAAWLVRNEVCSTAYRDQVKAVGGGRGSSEVGKRETRPARNKPKFGNWKHCCQGRCSMFSSHPRRETVVMKKTLMRIIESDQ
jgi:hypothetical protein